MSKNCLQDARVHYAVLKKQPHTSTTLPTQQQHRGGPATHPTPTTNPSTNKESRRPWGRVQPHNPIACLHLKPPSQDRKSTRLNSSHVAISYAVFCLKNKNPHQ